MKPHELEDSATEVVEERPLRRSPKSATLLEAAKSPSGGRMKVLNSSDRSDFVMIRSRLGAVNITCGHLEIFSALWKLWAAKRVQGGDAGVSVSELGVALGQPNEKMHPVLSTLIRNGIVRSVRTGIGWSHVRASYYPTEIGCQILALAEFFGKGSSIQIGGKKVAWNSRSRSEPDHLFQHAAFLKG